MTKTELPGIDVLVTSKMYSGVLAMKSAKLMEECFLSKQVFIQFCGLKIHESGCS